MPKKTIEKKIIPMHQPWFTFVKKEKPIHAYTHNLYFNGKLIATDVCKEEQDGWWLVEDRDSVIDASDLADVPVEHLPEFFYLDFKITNHSTFDSGYLKYKDRTISFEFFLCDISDEDVSMLGLVYLVDLHLQEQPEFTGKLQDVGYIIKYTTTAQGTVGNALHEALSKTEAIIASSKNEMRKLEKRFEM